jgi:hypothetical protein
LPILLLTTCNVPAKTHPSHQKDNLPQAQAFAGDLENENVKPFELLLVLGAMAFPITMMCSYELCCSARARQLHSAGSFLPIRAAHGSRASHDIGFFLSVDRKRIF